MNPLFFMPTLQEHLIDDLGLQSRTARFFSSRELPAGNVYWHKQSVYMSTAPGYVFIPVYFDLLIRQNVSADVLLSDDVLDRMERILDSAGRLEHKKIDDDQHLAECRDILKAGGISDDAISRVELELVNRPFTRIPPKFRSLRRANTFLYTFAGVEYDPTVLFASWEQTVPFFLMLDDFSDIESDTTGGDENCLLDGGAVAENFFELTALVDEMMSDLTVINPTLSVYLRNLKNEAVAKTMLSVLVSGK